MVRMEGSKKKKEVGFNRLVIVFAKDDMVVKKECERRAKSAHVLRKQSMLTTMHESVHQYGIPNRHLSHGHRTHHQRCTQLSL